MSEHQISEHFVIQEFVNPETYAEHKEDSIDFIDKKLIDIAEFVRVDLGVAVTINNWHTGGQFKESGLRDSNTKTGSKKSAHKSGKAIDVKVKGMTGNMWYEFVKRNAKNLYDLGLRRIEDKSLAISWCHMDTKEHGEPHVIQIVDLTEVTEKIKIIGI